MIAERDERMNSLYIVVPCYNEEAVLPESAPVLLAKLRDLVAAGKLAPDSRVLFVDDGSADASAKIGCGQTAVALIQSIVASTKPPGC